MKILNNINLSGKSHPVNSIKKTVKSFYYASRPLYMEPKGAPKQPFFTKIKNFFKALYNANFKK